MSDLTEIEVKGNKLLAQTTCVIKNNHSMRVNNPDEAVKAISEIINNTDLSAPSVIIRGYDQRTKSAISMQVKLNPQAIFEYQELPNDEKVKYFLKSLTEEQTVESVASFQDEIRKEKGTSFP